MIQEKAALITADIGTTNPHLAEFGASSPFSDIVAQIIAALMKALSGCGLSAAQSTAVMQKQDGLLGWFYDRQLSKIIRKTIDDPQTAARLSDPIKSALKKAGKTITEDETGEMMSEAA